MICGVFHPLKALIFKGVFGYFILTFFIVYHKCMKIAIGV